MSELVKIYCNVLLIFYKLIANCMLHVSMYNLLIPKAKLERLLRGGMFVSSEASPTICSCFANLDPYHFSFLSRMIPYTVINTEKFSFP